MRILCIDIGTGTQDIILFDTRLEIENSYKLIVPSPTMIIHQRIQAATRAGRAVVLTGTLMGGGPSAWAAGEHIRCGLKVYATPQAARSFNDDLEVVRDSGVMLVSEDEALKLAAEVERIELKDFDHQAVADAFAAFGVSLHGLDAAVLAVFDHGNAPVDVSDRKFRFDYLDERLRQANRLSIFSYQPADIPPAMTRLQAVAVSAQALECPLVVMDTAPAAVLGALLDRKVCTHERVMAVNIGNFHTLAFRMSSRGVEGLFEHHTGLLNTVGLDDLLTRLAGGSLTNEAVFASQGHGALVYEAQPLDLRDGDFGVAVSGPRRSLMAGSSLRPYFVAPFGDMMAAGCYGMLAAAADVLPQMGEEIHQALYDERRGAAPWEI
jgi:uncharacterized protein (DUF1786 family)